MMDRDVEYERSGDGLLTPHWALSLGAAVIDHDDHRIEHSTEAFWSLVGESGGDRQLNVPLELQDLLSAKSPACRTDTDERVINGRSLRVSRLSLGTNRSLILLSPDRSDAESLAARLYNWHRDCVTDIVGMIAQDMQGTASSLLYNAAFLASQSKTSDQATHDEARADLLTMTRSMSAFLGRLSDMVRLGEAARQTVSLESLVQGARRTALRRNPRCNVTLQAGFGQDCYLQTNPILARHALAELLVNASEASDQGPVQVTQQRIVVNQEPLVRIRVRDDGRGIEKDQVAKIFQPFFSTQLERNGLGLTVAREAARTLGGELVLESPSSPTVFALLLPGAPVRAEDRPA